MDLEGSCPVRAHVPSLPNFLTRDILTMWGTIEGEPFYFMVIHWPSRLGGKEASAFKRNALGEQMFRLADSVRRANPAVKVVAMGDFNDDPTDPSMEEYMQAKGSLKEVAPNQFFNPYHEMLRKGEGTLAYGDAWNIFDNIVVSENLAKGTTGELTLQRDKKTKYYGHIFRQHYLFQQEGQYRGYPLRTYVGNTFQGGFSDHLPVFIYIAK